MAYPDTIDRNRFAGQFGSVPQNPGIAPSTGDSIMSWLGSGVQALLGNPGALIGKGLGFLTGTVSNLINFDRQKQLKQMDFDNNMAMFNATNEYNSPANQRALWEAAGYSPATMPQSAGTTPGASPVTGGSPNAVENVSGQFAQQMGSMLQDSLTADYLKAQKDEAEARADYTRSQNFEQQVRNKYAEQFVSGMARKAVADGDISEEFAYQASVDSLYKGANAYVNYQQQVQALANASKQWEIMNQEVYNKYAEYQLIMEQIGLTAAEISKVWSEVGVNQAMIHKLEAEKRNIDADTAVTWQEADMNTIKRDILNFQKQQSQYYMQTLTQYGWDMNSSVNDNLGRLAARGETSRFENGLDFIERQTAAYGSGRAAGADFKSQRNRDIARMVIGGLEFAAGLGITVFSSGAGSAVGVPIMIHGLARGTKGGFNMNNGQGRYDGNWNNLE